MEQQRDPAMRVVLNLPVQQADIPLPKPVARWKSHGDIPPLTGKDLRGMSETQRRTLQVCAEALRNYEGCVTPAEEFINHILILYACGRVTPDDVQEDLNELRENFNSMAESVRRFNRDYGWWMEREKRKAPAMGKIAEAQNAGSSNSTQPQAYSRRQTGATSRDSQ